MGQPGHTILILISASFHVLRDFVIYTGKKKGLAFFKDLRARAPFHYRSIYRFKLYSDGTLIHLPLLKTMLSHGCSYLVSPSSLNLVDVKIYSVVNPTK